MQASVHAEVDACMLGLLVTGLLSLLGSCVHDCQGYLGFLGCWVRWVARSPRSLGNRSQQFREETCGQHDQILGRWLPGSGRENLGRGALATKVNSFLKKLLTT